MAMHIIFIIIPNLRPATVIAYGTEIIPVPKLVDIIAKDASMTLSPVFFGFHAF